jgi:anthranilate/para-aminobenzoate synthase component I
MLFTEKLTNWWYNPDDIYLALYSNLENSFYFDRSQNQFAYSIIGSGESFSFSSFDDLELGEQEHQIDLPFDFRPGVVVALNYEMGLAHMGIGGGGESRGIQVDRAMVFGHRERACWLIGEFPDQQAFDNWKHSVFLRIALTGGESLTVNGPISSTLSAKTSRQDYLLAVENCRMQIEKGDSYQLCLTTQLVGSVDSDANTIFYRLKKNHPAPYASIINFGDCQLISISPELFFASSSGQMRSSPIKGTRPRSANQEEDRKISEALRGNEKERAENLMIVDLVRNDFTKVAEIDSVVTEQLFELKSFSSVHQLVSTVAARLGHGKTVIDAIQSLFPAGSMTGAPKHSAVSFLANIEAGERGLYSGAFGWIASNGDSELAMTIRSIVLNNGDCAIGVGGGITWGSEPESEYAEMQLKAKAIVETIEGSVTW